MHRPLALLVLAVLAAPACSSSDQSAEQPVQPRAIPSDPSPVEPPEVPEEIDMQLELPGADGKYDPVLTPRSGDTAEREVVEPQSGQLTAGEWNDHDHWAHWLELLQDTQTEGDPNFWQHEATWHVAPRARYPVAVVDAYGNPEIDVPVELRTADGLVWSARTDHAGRAWLFDGAYGTPVEKPLQITIGKAVFDPPADQTLTTIRLDDRATPRSAVDVMFMVDTTGSMGDELNYLKVELRDVVRQVEHDYPNVALRLSVNFYRDTSDRYVVRSFPFTTNVVEVQNQIAAQSANGGGDTPEAVDAALQSVVVDHQWSPSARARLAFLVLDAPPHQSPQTLERFHDATRKAAAAGIEIIPVIGSGAHKDTEYLMRSAAILTGGTYVFLTDDSGIGGGHTRPTIGPHDVEYLRDLLVRVIGERIQ